MKITPTFNFTDEPQIKTTMTRSEAARKLWAYRKRQVGHFCYFSLTKVDNGYLVNLKGYSSPTGFIGTK